MSGSTLSGQDYSGASIPSELHPGVSYELERRLGSGGTAAAYYAVRHGRDAQVPVVMKIILPEVVAGGGATAATVVKKEAVALGRLNERVPPTPFVVRFMDVGVAPYRHRVGMLQLPWLAVEYVHGGVEGTTLEERVGFAVRQTGYAFDQERAGRALSHVSEGLGEVHAVGVVHRDLTPNNVLCCGFGSTELFKISDFGIARPEGLTITFGTGLIGTAGYMPPEQGLESAGAAHPVGDIFSLGAIAYFVLTGEQLFDTPNPLHGLMMAKAEARRSVLEARGLCPELREEPDTCRAIDEALARATAADPRLRPQSAKAFAASVLPWLSANDSHRPSRRHVTSVLQADLAPSAASWQWRVRRVPGDDRVVRSVGWDGDGHCLAATSAGLGYWDGTDWRAVDAGAGVRAEAVRYVQCVDPGRWVLAMEGAWLVEFSRDGVSRTLRGPDAQLAFCCVSGSLKHLAVVLAEHPGCAPLLCAYVGGYWMKPLPVTEACSVTSVAQLEEERWLVVGRGLDGKGYAALYSPLAWGLERVRAPDTRALVACAGQVECQLAVAVGADGAVLNVGEGRIRPQRLESRAHLASAAVDVLGRIWVGGAGQLWMSSTRGDEWQQIWRDDSWQAPFISILPNAGVLVAMTADGAVLEGRV